MFLTLEGVGVFLSCILVVGVCGVGVCVVCVCRLSVCVVVHLRLFFFFIRYFNAIFTPFQLHPIFHLQLLVCVMFSCNWHGMLLLLSC